MIREIIVEPVALGGQVDAIEIADALGLGQRGDRPGGDGEGPALDAGPIGIEPRVADDVQGALALRAGSADMALSSKDGG